MRSPPRGCAAALVASLVAATGCKTTGSDKPAASAAAGPAAAKSARIEVDQAGLVAALVRKHGEPSRARAERGIRQVSAYWPAGDGGQGALRNLVEDGFRAGPQALRHLPRPVSAQPPPSDGPP